MLPAAPEESASAETRTIERVPSIEIWSAIIETSPTEPQLSVLAQFAPSLVVPTTCALSKTTVEPINSMEAP